MEKEQQRELQTKKTACSRGDFCLGVLFAFFLLLGMFCINNEKIKMYFVDFNGFLSQCMGQRFLNETLLLENGHLISPEEERLPEAMEQNAADLEELRQFAESIDAEFLYVPVPAKNVLHGEDLPEGVNDFAISNLDYFMECLAETQVDYIDVRMLLEEKEEPALNYYYLSDHHWKISYGLEFAGYLARYFNEEMGMNCDLSYLSPERFTTEVYEDWHLGSHGRRVGRFFGPGADAFEYIYPSYETMFANVNSGQEGDFRSVLTGEEGLEERNYYWGFVYDVVYEKMLYQHIDNLMNEDGPRLYVISDSMGHAVFPFLSLVCDEIYWGGLDQEEIRAFQPDIIIVMRWSRTLL